MKINYSAPELIVIKVMMERGFFVSGKENSGDGGMGLPDWEVI